MDRRDERDLNARLALDKLGVAYEKVDVTRDSDARDYVMSLGHLSAPVVVVGRDHWAGFRPDRIAALGNEEILSSDATLVS